MTWLDSWGPGYRDDEVTITPSPTTPAAVGYRILVDPPDTADWLTAFDESCPEHLVCRRGLAPSGSDGDLVLEATEDLTGRAADGLGRRWAVAVAAAGARGVTVDLQRVRAMDHHGLMALRRLESSLHRRRTALRVCNAAPLQRAVLDRLSSTP